MTNNALQHRTAFAWLPPALWVGTLVLVWPAVAFTTQMPLARELALGLLAGLHGASYGAYKDSPHESFLTVRFVRELAIALLVALWLASLHAAESPFIFFVTTFTLTRMITEFWKLFVRIEPQDGFRIPTQFHWLRGVVHSPSIRLLVGAGWLGAIYGTYCLFKLLPHDLPRLAVGIVVGGGFGLVEAIAGAYKDGSIEGFSPWKFLKSPVFGAIGGMLASWHTYTLLFLMLAAYGSSRMFLELLFKILPRDYAPGKFPSMIGSFPQWMVLRKHFLLPYGVTWLCWITLLLQ